jgi:plasmid maintenance system antidote protein VapI
VANVKIALYFKYTYLCKRSHHQSKAMDKKELLKKYLFENEITQTQLAEKLGKTQATVSAYLNGKVKLTGAVWDEIKAAIPINEDELMMASEAEISYGNNDEHFYKKTINTLTESVMALTNQIDKMNDIIKKLISA